MRTWWALAVAVSGLLLAGCGEQDVEPTPEEQQQIQTGHQQFQQDMEQQQKQMQGKR